ncbi:MAG: anaerobic ribonucleoside-triphosphate reductase activating protein [Bacillota bacterium]
MNISGIIKSSLIDYPGLISCVLFVPGCNYSCYYCHNRSLIDGTHILLTPQSVTDFLKKRAGLLDGVVISGGEPTLQADLLWFLQMIRDLGYAIKLDTNGSHPEVVEKILQQELCDYFAVDYKAPSEQYPQICGAGADAQKVIETIHLLSESTVPFEVRTTVIPHFGREELVRMAKEIPAVPKYVYNRYKKPEKFLPKDKDRIMATPYTQDELQTLADNIVIHQPNITI